MSPASVLFVLLMENKAAKNFMRDIPKLLMRCPSNIYLFEEQIVQ